MKTSLPIVRHLLQLAAGALVARGMMDDGTATELTGALISVVSIVWMIIEKRKNQAVNQASNPPISTSNP